MTTKHQPNGKWLDSQRLPHTDIRWDLGVRTGEERNVPPSLATVYTLTDKFNDTGTTLWRTRGSKTNPDKKMSLLRTLPMNEEAQGSFNPSRPESNRYVERSVDRNDERRTTHACLFTSTNWYK